LQFTANLKLTTDTSVKRLRWLMVGVDLFDKFNTLVGQPGTYWRHPETADEINRSWHYALVRGFPFYLLASAVAIVILLLIVSILPRKIALIIIFAVILNKYVGACSWLTYHWHFGVRGPVIYGTILSVILVLLAFPKSLSKERDV
jgi:hypothetical protein